MPRIERTRATSTSTHLDARRAACHVAPFPIPVPCSLLTIPGLPSRGRIGNSGTENRERERVACEAPTHTVRPQPSVIDTSSAGLGVLSALLFDPPNPVARLAEAERKTPRPPGPPRQEEKVSTTPDRASRTRAVCEHAGAWPPTSCSDLGGLGGLGVDPDPEQAPHTPVPRSAGASDLGVLSALLFDPPNPVLEA